MSSGQMLSKHLIVVGVVLFFAQTCTAQDYYEHQVETLPAIDVTENSAKLRGNLVMGLAETAFVWFEYRVENGEIQKTSWEPKFEDGEFDYTLENLRPNTTYHFRAMVGEENQNGVWMQFTTLGLVENVDLSYLVEHFEEFENKKVRVTGTVSGWIVVEPPRAFWLDGVMITIPDYGARPPENSVVTVVGTVSRWGEGYAIHADNWSLSALQPPEGINVAWVVIGAVIITAVVFGLILVFKKQ